MYIYIYINTLRHEILTQIIPRDLFSYFLRDLAPSRSPEYIVNRILYCLKSGIIRSEWHEMDMGCCEETEACFRYSLT